MGRPEKLPNAPKKECEIGWQQGGRGDRPSLRAQVPKLQPEEY